VDKLRRVQALANAWKRTKSEYSKKKVKPDFSSIAGSPGENILEVIDWQMVSAAKENRD